MNGERRVLVGGGIVLALAFLIGMTGQAGAASGASGLSRYVPDPAAVLRLCGQEQVGTRELAGELARRDRALKERDQTLAAREAELAEAEKRLDARLAELSALRSEVSKRLDEADEDRAKRLAGLVTMVEKNRPGEIAPMFSALEEPLAVQVLERMNRAKAGKLLAVLDPALAARLAAAMTAPIAVGNIPDPRAITTAPGAVATPPIANAPAAPPVAAAAAPAATPAAPATAPAPAGAP